GARGALHYASYRERRMVDGGAGQRGVRVVWSAERRRRAGTAGVGDSIRRLCGLAKRVSKRESAGRRSGELEGATEGSSGHGVADGLWEAGGAQPSRRKRESRDRPFLEGRSEKAESERKRDDVYGADGGVQSVVDEVQRRRRCGGGDSGGEPDEERG